MTKDTIDFKLEIIDLYWCKKSNCLDNAVIESFFGTLKQEIFFDDKHQRRFTFIDELKHVIDEYIHYYNHDRIKGKSKGLSPVQYSTETQSLDKPKP